MRHLAAYLLLQIGGNASPSAADAKKVLGAVGIEADDERLEKLISELAGKDVNALIAEGSSKLASVSDDSLRGKFRDAYADAYRRCPLVVRSLPPPVVLPLLLAALLLPRRRRRRRKRRRYVHDACYRSVRASRTRFYRFIGGV